MGLLLREVEPNFNKLLHIEEALPGWIYPFFEVGDLLLSREEASRSDKFGCIRAHLPTSTVLMVLG